MSSALSQSLGLNEDVPVEELEVLLEITEWPDNTPNHTYLVDKSRGHLLAYRNVLTGKVDVFSKPSKLFSKSKRKFKRVVDKELERAYTV